MADDISKVDTVPCSTLHHCSTPVLCASVGTCKGRHVLPAKMRAAFDRLESATTPAEVDVPTIDRDEAFQRDYIPLGRSGWEIQTKGKGSTYRICDKDGDRLAIPDTPYLHETLTRMAREVHADYTTLARQLAEAKAENKTRAEDYATLTALWQADAAKAESQLAEATRRLGEVEIDAARWQRWLPWLMQLNKKPFNLAKELDAIAKLTKETTR